LVINKNLQTIDQLSVFEANPHLVDLFVAVVQHWLSSRSINSELFIIQTLTELMDLMVYSPRFWNAFKNNSQIVNLFIGTQARPDMSAMTKSKILRIIKILSLRDHGQLPAPSSNLMRPRHDPNQMNRDYIGAETGALPQTSALMPVYEQQRSPYDDMQA